jgi:DTW domain-containing protein YfiP
MTDECTRTAPGEAVSGRPAMRSRRIERCTTCGLYLGLCLCGALPRLEPRTQVTVIAHRKELFKSTNTGKLAVHMLQRASVFCSGADPRASTAVRAERESRTPALADAHTWVLFPSEDAIPLASAAARGLTRLLVPDGTWQQAKRIARRDPLCAGVRCVRLEATRASTYALRRNSREHALCTLEAIAEALRVLEGDALADALLAAFESWVARAQLVRAGAHAKRSRD